MEPVVNNPATTSTSARPNYSVAHQHESVKRATAMVFLGSCFGQAGAHASGSSRAHQRQTGTHRFACRKRSTEPERQSVATPATTRAARAICSPPFGPRHRPPHPKRGGASRLPFHSTFRDGGAHTDLSSARLDRMRIARYFCWRAWTRIAAVLCSSCPSTVGKIYEPSVLQFPLVASFRR